MFSALLRHAPACVDDLTRQIDLDFHRGKRERATAAFTVDIAHQWFAADGIHQIEGDSVARALLIKLSILTSGMPGSVWPAIFCIAALGSTGPTRFSIAEAPFSVCEEGSTVMLHCQRTAACYVCFSHCKKSLFKFGSQGCRLVRGHLHESLSQFKWT